MTRWYHILLFSLAITRCKALCLDGDWLISDVTGKYINLTGTVPGGIYTDLKNNNIIGDVLYGNNDTQTRWVAQTNWTYTYNLELDANYLKQNVIELVFEGLDTFTTILVNGVEVGSSDNMFLRYIFNVKEVMQVGTNTIEVKFISPILKAQELLSKQNYSIPPECPPGLYNGECHVNQIRKMQASFSWDWGPAVPSMGMWKPVYLESYNSSKIRYLVVEYEDSLDDNYLIKVSTYLSAQKGAHIIGNLIYKFETDVDTYFLNNEVDQTNTGSDTEIKVNAALTIPKLVVRQWWPNGYGTQKLYKLTVTYQKLPESTSKTVTIGFRKIELVQEPIGSGLSFYFKVNGLPFFAKGANEIPLDILPEKGQNPEIISKILESAAAVNMNMLRVWGGGVYESDEFYQKADELGILIWQDFMFACAMYPSYSDFLENVKTEVRHQYKRLNTHPSIALWAGNNENEIALMTNWYGLQNNLTVYKNDYLKLYIDTICSELFNLTDHVIFVSSSPSNGKESEAEGYLSKNPGNPLFGDVHFYNYVLDSLHAITYPIPRFASEYGYQSLPDIDSWLTVTDNVSNLNDDFLAHRQHHPLGFFEMNLLIGYQLKLYDNLQDLIFHSQIIQAMSIKFETEYYRSFMDRVDEQGRGNTMGALFWQLNDVWVAPTWSGIDYTGKWKMLQYYAKDFFAPTIITGYLDIFRQLRLYVVSELISLVNSPLDVSAIVSVYNWSSFTPMASTQINITLEFGKSIPISVIDTDMYLQGLNCGSLSDARKNCFFYLTLISGNSVIAPHNIILAAALKDSNLLKTESEIVAIAQLDDLGVKFEISVQVTGITMFVWLDSHQILGRFSENGFAQVTPVKNVTFQAEKATSVDELKETITIVHLNVK